MLNAKIQFILVLIIIAAVVIWTIYKLVKSNKSGNKSFCASCALSDGCAKKDLKQRMKLPEPDSCDECVVTDTCEKKKIGEPCHLK